MSGTAPGSTDYIVFTPEEVKTWNAEHEPDDGMAAWVCAIGGYEVLVDGNVEVATKWMVAFGLKTHQRIRGGPFLSRENHRLRAATHYGYTWWQGSEPPRWPEQWQQMLDDQFWRRLRSGVWRVWKPDHAKVEELNAFLAQQAEQHLEGVMSDEEPPRG